MGNKKRTSVFHIRTTVFIVLFYLTSYSCLEYEKPHFRNRRIQRSNGDDIDMLIWGLNYNPDEILAFRAPGITSVKKEGSVNHDGKFIVIERERKSISNGKADIGVISSNEHRTYPGSLLIANSHLIDNSPDIISVDRAPMKYTVNLPGLIDTGSFTIIPSFPAYQKSLNKVLENWFDNYYNGHEVNAMFQSESTLAYSKEQLRVKFGMDFKFTAIESSIDFNAVNNQEKLIMIHRFKQIFYTVSVESPRKPSDLFGRDVKSEMLSWTVNDLNPPVLVDTVSYGRVIYLKIETSSTDKNAKFILENRLAKFNVGNSNEFEYAKQLKNINMQVYVMGGGTQHIDLINVKDADDVKKIIGEYGKFSRKNLGYPLSYASQFIKDNSRALVTGMTDYIETTRTEHEKGLIKLKHTGFYVAQFKVEWDEVTIDESGNERLERKGWERNLQDLTIGFNTEIQLPGNSRNIDIFAKECTALPWEWWRTVIDRKNVPLIGERSIHIWGTTLNPKYEIVPPV